MGVVWKHIFGLTFLKLPFLRLKSTTPEKSSGIGGPEAGSTNQILEDHHIEKKGHDDMS